MNNQLSLQVSKIANNLSNTSIRRLLAIAQSNESSNASNASQLGMLRSKSTKRVGLKLDSFVQGIREHVRLSPKLTETMKGKLSLGAKIIQLGGIENAFKHLFGINGNDEKLLKASQCYLSTTDGPIAGLLFISNFKIAFFSERSIKTVSSSGKILRLHYKVSIPCVKIAGANGSENVKRSSQKYIQIITDDNFEFWFMGFLNLDKTLEYLHLAIYAESEFIN